jgi:hypothetical protein
MREIPYKHVCKWMMIPVESTPRMGKDKGE